MPVAATSAGDVVDRIWREVTHHQAPPSDGAIWATAAVALALVLLPATWPIVRHLVTMAHEGGHGLVALLTGRKLRGIRLQRDTSGSATSKGRARGPGMILTTAAGYPAPALLGLGAALLLGHRHAQAVLWLGVLLLLLMLVQIRNLWGLLTVLGAGAAVFAVSWWASDQLQSLVAYGAAWFLLLAAPRPVLELQRTRARGRGQGSDADVLAGLTPLPGLVWIALFLTANGAALYVGARQLLP